MPAPVAAVWQALNDPAALKACIPGCESLERIGDDEWQATMAARVGPVSAKFSGRMRMTDSTPPTGYTLKFEGQGGAAGFANGEARVTLAPAARQSDDADLCGQGAGRRQARADRIAADRWRRREACRRFLREIRRAIRAGGGEGELPTACRRRAGASTFAGAPWVRYMALALIVAIMAWLYIRGGVRF